MGEAKRTDAKEFVAMGEARRRKEMRLMPEKTTLPVPTTKKNWADILTDEQKEEAKKDRMHLLEYNLPNIRGYYRDALARGMKRPIVIAADTRDDYGRELLRLADKKGLEINKDYADAGLIPTVIMAVPYSEDALKVFGSMMTPNGRRCLEMVASASGCIPVVVIAAHGNSYVGVSEEE